MDGRASTAQDKALSLRVGPFPLYPDIGAQTVISSVSSIPCTASADRYGTELAAEELAAPRDCNHTVTFKHEYYARLRDFLVCQTLKHAFRNLVEFVCWGGHMADFYGGSDADVWTGGDSTEIARGGGGDDILTGGGGDDVLDGQAGQDTARYAGSLADYRVFGMSDGSYRVIHTANQTYHGSRVTALMDDPDSALRVMDATGPEGYDQLFSVDQISFADGNFAISAVSAPLGQFIYVPGFFYASWYDATAFDHAAVASDGNDDLAGSAGYDIILSGSGDDIIDAGGGDDLIAGDRGRWHYFANGASVIDTDGVAGSEYAVTGRDIINAGAGNDDMYIGYGTVVDGGSGIDTVHFSLENIWLPWVAGSVLYWFNDYALNIDLRDAASSTVSFAVSGLGGDTGLVTTLTGVERFDLALGGGNDKVTGAVFADVLSGNGGDDMLAGEGGDDHLSGGDGNDVLSGGMGDDVIESHGGNDTVSGGAGVDTAIYYDSRSNFAISYVGDGRYTVTDLRANSPFGADMVSGIEFLRFNDQTVSTAPLSGGVTINGTVLNDTISPTKAPAGQPKATSGDDTLIGNGGNDRLDGGEGADHLLGGIGNDSYTVDNADDEVVENAGEGTDTVNSSVSFTLSAYVEKLTLSGAGDIAGTGNALVNVITGNDGANLLAGLAGNDTLKGGDGDDRLIGGVGKDALTGGLGSDTFVFDAMETTANKDTIKDFVSGLDHIEIRLSAFAALADYEPGVLDAGELAFGTQAITADQHLIYNQAKGALYYDADGLGGAAQVQIALLSGKPVIDAGDIVLI